MFQTYDLTTWPSSKIWMRNIQVMEDGHSVRASLLNESQFHTKFNFARTLQVTF